jgi:hypothetical protein
MVKGWVKKVSRKSRLNCLAYCTSPSVTVRNDLGPMA